MYTVLLKFIKILQNYNKPLCFYASFYYSI